MSENLGITQSSGFANVAARWPWPEASSLADVEPFTWSLDGGGRELIASVIDGHPSGVLLEIGSFMGGAVRAWMQAYPDLRCVCVDPWGGNIANYTRNLMNVEWALQAYGVERLETYAEALEAHGTMAIVQNNLHEFKDRCVLVRAGVPEVFDMLEENNFQPDIVFLDAMKRKEEFVGVHERYPNAIITGDDWSWKSPEGEFPVREYAALIARRRSAKVYAHRATFVLSEERHSLSMDENFLFTETG